MKRARARGFLVASLLIGAVLVSLPAKALEPPADSSLAQRLEWERVNDDGFGDEANTSTDAFAILGNHLYAGTFNKAGTQIYRTADGKTWSQVNKSGFGDKRNKSTASLAVFDGHLYAATFNDAGTQVWKTDGLGKWTQANESAFGDKENVDALGLAVFKGHLYVGTYKLSSDGEGSKTGTEIWRTADGATWAQVNTDGFGKTSNQWTGGLAVLNGRLYAVTANSFGGSEVWRSSDGTRWEQRVGDKAGDGNGLRTATVYGLFAASTKHLYAGARAGSLYKSTDGKTWTLANDEGFGNGNNGLVRSFAEVGGDIYAGTSNPVNGTEVYRAKDGVLPWTQCNNGGFAASRSESEPTGTAGNQSTFALAAFGEYLYAGTFNETGTEVWRARLVPEEKPPEPDEVKADKGGIGIWPVLIACLAAFGVLVVLVVLIVAIVFLRRKRT